MSLTHEKGSEILIVVDFPIEDNPYVAVLVADGLLTCIEVNDRQTSMAESHLRILIDPFIIRTPMAYRLQHCPDETSLNLGAFLESQFSADSAHVSRP